MTGRATRANPTNWWRTLFAVASVPRNRSAVALTLTLFGWSLAGCALGQILTEFPVPTANAFPYGIAAGPDGNLWFAEFNANRIGRITWAGVVTEFSSPLNPLVYCPGSSNRARWPCSW